MTLGKELKEFLMRGNVVDMAVGIVIGGAFGKVVTSFVNDILMPLLSPLLGNTNFADLHVVLKQAIVDAQGTETAAAITWNYGSFIQTIVDFLIVGTAIFFAIKAMNKLARKKKEEPAPAPAPEPSAEEKLLAEIRDLLKKD